jgi:hypothetical protein
MVYVHCTDGAMLRQNSATSFTPLNFLTLLADVLFYQPYHEVCLRVCRLPNKRTVRLAGLFPLFQIGIWYLALCFYVVPVDTLVTSNKDFWRVYVSILLLDK